MQKVLKKDLNHLLKSISPTQNMISFNETIGSLQSNILRSNLITKELETSNEGGCKEYNDLILFTHLKDSPIEENYNTLKEALLELYLSVKIRSDEEIDMYNEEQFKLEKE